MKLLPYYFYAAGSDRQGADGMKVYLAGGMRGYPSFNFPSFDAAAAELRKRFITVISPAEIDRELGFDPTGLEGTEAELRDMGFDLHAAMQRDLLPVPYVPVSVRFDVLPPRIVMLTSVARTNVDENMVEVLDWANIENADIIVRAYEWEVNGKKGLKAYLKSLFVTIEEDYLERKYAVAEASEDVRHGG